MKRRAYPGEATRYFSEVVIPYDGDDCLLWPFATAFGYGKIFVEGRLRTVSRLVCEHANGPPPTPRHEAAHQCGRGREGCVTKRHLSWKTSAENKADKVAHGTDNRGARHPMAVLTEGQVRMILRLKGRLSQRKIAELVGVGQPQISFIHSGKAWAHLKVEDETAQAAWANEMEPA